MKKSDIKIAIIIFLGLSAAVILGKIVAIMFVK